MGRKKKEETVVEEAPKKKKGRPAGKKNEPKKAVSDSKLSSEDIKTLQEIEKSLLKKCKKEGFINQSEIYDALNNYELDDVAIDELIAFFADNNIKVVNEDEDEEDNIEEEFDESVLDEAIVFVNTSKQAARIKCATIGWDAMEEIICNHHHEK